MAFDESSITTTSPVTQESHYYPFGLRLAGLTSTAGKENKFLYNGKELEDDHGLMWYHYGARYYDPQLGRWWAVDPVDEFWSPFAYVGNNPINFIGPDGREIHGTKGDVQTTADKINMALRDAGISSELAFAAVASKEVDVTREMDLSLLEWAWRTLTGQPTTTTSKETVYYLTLNGKGWEMMRKGKLSADIKYNEASKYGSKQEYDRVATAAFLQLQDLAEMPETITVVWSYFTAEGEDVGEKYHGGYNDDMNRIVYLRPGGNPYSPVDGPVGILFHELVGHSHPAWYGKNAYILNNVFNGTSRNPAGVHGQLGGYVNYIKSIK